MMLEPLMTLPEVANELRVSVPTLRNWARRGQLSVVRLPGGTLRVTRNELNRLAALAAVDGDTFTTVDKT